jgi:hypothetical protein
MNEPNGIITKFCGGCPTKSIRYLCVSCDRYHKPSTFVRDNGDFMCPSAFHLQAHKTKKVVRKVRVGQQKQKRNR